MDIGRIIRRIIRKCPPVTYLFIPILKLKDSLQTKEMHQRLAKACRTFCTPEELGNKTYMRRLRRDMWYSFLRYHCTFSEYFLLHFQRLSPIARYEFVTEYEKDALCEALSLQAAKDVFTDKGKAYLRFSQYYKRDAFIVSEEADYQGFLQFTATHPKYIVKPRFGLGGHGVRIVEGGDPEELFRQYQAEGVILEELIRQDEALGRFHPASVNTIRCATFVGDGTPHLLFTFLRMGQGDSVVDNGSSGGLIAAVDMQAGIVTTPAITENGSSVLFHPDTGVQILGAAIPRWEELKDFACQLALSYPEVPYISWDLALTPDGWVIVEGNSYGQFIGPQLTTQKGIREQLSCYFDLDP